MTDAEGPPRPGEHAPRRERSRVVLVALAGAVVVGLGVAVATRSFSALGTPPFSVSSPLNATLSWFADVNAHDRSLALEHFTASSSPQMQWSSWPTPFRQLRCRIGHQSSTSTVVDCTFAVQNDPSAGLSNVSFWSIDLQRTARAGWLIVRYGQG